MSQFGHVFAGAEIYPGCVSRLRPARAGLYWWLRFLKEASLLQGATMVIHRCGQVYDLKVSVLHILVEWLVRVQLVE